MVAMAFGVLFWAEANFVSASEYTQQQYREVNNEVLYLEDRKARLESESKNLSYEDRRSLERKKEERNLLKQQMKN